MRYTFKNFAGIAIPMNFESAIRESNIIEDSTESVTIQQSAEVEGAN